MPDPISTSSSSPPPVSTYDPYADDVGQMSRADAPNSSQAQPPVLSSEAAPAATPSAVPKLVSSVSPPPSVLPPTASSPPASSANNNAQRTSEQIGIGPYASAGYTAAGDSVYASVALLKGHDPKSGLDAEVISLSAQVGAQNELQFGLQRAGAASGSAAGGVETFTARLNSGIYNDDGSTGRNIGVSATAIGFETTVGGADSVTYGVSAGVGLAGSVGLRDSDGDGKPELCFRASFSAITLGACKESPL